MTLVFQWFLFTHHFNCANCLLWFISISVSISNGKYDLLKSHCSSVLWVKECVSLKCAAICDSCQAQPLVDGLYSGLVCTASTFYKVAPTGGNCPSLPLECRYMGRENLLDWGGMGMGWGTEHWKEPVHCLTSTSGMVFPIYEASCYEAKPG